jgi:hypothetical protein
LEVSFPYSSVIEDNTTRLAKFFDIKLGVHGYCYPTRCEKCAALALQRKRLKLLRLLADDDTSLTCSSEVCLLPRWEDVILCHPNLLKAFAAERQGLVTPGSIIEAQKYIRSHQFEATSRFKATLDILDRMDPKGRKAWCIDLEFSTRKKLVYEIAIVEYHTGAVVLDALVKQDKEAIVQAGKRSRALDGEDSVEDYDQRLIELLHRRAVYNSGRSTRTDFLDAHSIARVIRESEIKSMDIMFEHASCQVDLKMLREFLESYGYYNPLPSLNNCHQTIPELRKNLPVGVSAALDIIFPLLFPNDPFVGQSHHARPDALMCRKIVKVIRELIKPPKERKLAEYEPEIIRLLLQAGMVRSRKD